MATAYGLKFYKTVQGVNVADGNSYPVTLKIYEKDYNGFSSEIEALGADSIRISYGNQGDRRYEPIKKTSIGFSIVDTEQFDYSQFYTSDATKYKVEVDALGFKHVGFIVQDSFSRNLSYRALINLTAIDNLSILDDIKFNTLNLPKYCKIQDVIDACISRCYPDATVTYKVENAYYYGDKDESGTGVISQLLYHRLTINTASLKDKTLNEVLEEVLLSGMMYIYQSATGYIVREYINDYTTSSILKRKVNAQFDGNSELTMTPAVRNFELINNLNEFNAMGDLTPSKTSEYTFDKASSIASDLLVNWVNVYGSLTGANSPIDDRPTTVKASGLPMMLPYSNEVNGYHMHIFPNNPFQTAEPNSTIEIGIMPSSFRLVFNLKTNYSYRDRVWKESQLSNITLRYAIYYVENGNKYYYNSTSNSFQQSFNLEGINVDNANGDIVLYYNVQNIERSASKTFFITLYPPMSTDEQVRNRNTGGGYITLSSISINHIERINVFDSSNVKIKVGENNLDASEEVLFSGAPTSDRGNILLYNNMLISTLNNNMDLARWVRPISALNIGDMSIAEYQARACLFLTEAPAKKVNGGVFMNTNDMVADYMTTETGSYLSSGTDQIVIADTKSSKGITRVDTLFDFILATKFGDYRINQAEINLLRFAIDGEFCEVKEFYISDYIANQPIINTFIQRNYLKHS